MAAQYRMFGMHLVQRAARIFHGSPEEMSCQLILLIFDAPSVCVAKEKPDHAVIEYSINKRINDRSHLRLASELLKKSLVHGDGSAIRRILEGLLYSKK